MGHYKRNTLRCVCSMVMINRVYHECSSDTGHSAGDQGGRGRGRGEGEQEEEEELQKEQEEEIS